MRFVVKRWTGLGWQELIGFAIDGYVIGNLTGAVLPFSSLRAAGQVMVLAGLGSVTLDYFGLQIFRAGEPTTLGVTFPIRGNEEIAILDFPLRSVGPGRYEAFIPASVYKEIEGPMQYAIRTAGARTIVGGNLSEAQLTGILGRPVEAELPVEVEPSKPIGEATTRWENEADLSVDDPMDSGVRNPDAIAVVIGIEHYAGTVPPVRFARRDAIAVERHLTRTLGVPPENVITLLDERATIGQMRTALEGQLRSMIEEGRSDVYVYFAGHGVPDAKSKSSFLVPHDGNPLYPEISCYPLDSAYKALATLKARSVTVMLDSCFSGGTGRSDDGTQTLLADARPLYVKVQPSNVPAGLTVFAGADGSQISSGYEKQSHGLFTYFFLRGLQGAADVNGDRRITTQELHRWMVPLIKREARRLNREQTPVLIESEQARELLQLPQDGGSN